MVCAGPSGNLHVVRKHCRGLPGEAGLSSTVDIAAVQNSQKIVRSHDNA
jgi:hypothetical protein